MRLFMRPVRLGSSALTTGTGCLAKDGPWRRTPERIEVIEVLQSEEADRFSFKRNADWVAEDLLEAARAACDPPRHRFAYCCDFTSADLAAERDAGHEGEA